MSPDRKSSAIIRKHCPSWALLEGCSFSGWKVLEPIGRGGSAEVYLAEDIKNGHKAALKLQLPEFRGDKESTKEFLREIDTLEELDHPGIPKMISHTKILDRDALIMDFIPGDNLMTMVYNKVKVPPLAVLIAAVKIINYLHEQNIIHNDIKLANFILSPTGRLHCIDFGSSKRLSLSSTFFRRSKNKGALEGTPSYVAPELIQGKSPTKQSDIWAIGILAHYLFTGSSPYENEDPQSILTTINNGQLVDLRKRSSAVDINLSNIIRLCLQTDPHDRDEDVEGLLARLRSYRD